MSEPMLAPRSPIWGLAITWAFGLVAAVAVGIVVPVEHKMLWFLIAFGFAVLVAFVVQLVRGEKDGFILRTAAGALGALLVMAVVSAGFGVVTLFSI